MNKRTLGKTGLNVTCLGFGAMEIGKLDLKDAETLLNEVLDQGITLIDSSPCYGRAEEYIGRAISHRRDEFVLATKCGCNVDENGCFLDKRDHIWTAAQLEKNIDQSLRLLRTDHIDIWQLHGIIPEYLQGGAEGEVLWAAEKIKRSGKVGHIAFSCRNGSPEQDLYPAGFGYEACKEMVSWGKFEAIQVVYGGLTRTNEHMIRRISDHGIGVICRGALKRYYPEYEEKARQAGLEELFEAGENLNEFLLRFSLSHPQIGSVIVGTKDREHLRENVHAACRGALKSDIWEEAKRRLDAAGVTARED